MSINAEIITTNSKFLNGKGAGGYHATTIARMLSSTDHLVATIDSVIKNNLLYGCKDGVVLEDVIITCNDRNAVDYINEHLNILFNYPDVRICICIDENCF